MHPILCDGILHCTYSFISTMVKKFRGGKWNEILYDKVAEVFRWYHPCDAGIV
jgi:hypothetical protein